MPTPETTTALAMQFHDHLQACTICRMPIDPKAWHGVVLCAVSKAWLDLHFPEDGKREIATRAV